MKKTKKYFRDKVNADIYSALEVLPEIVSHYGTNPGTETKCRGRKKIFVYTNMGWNYRITSFYFYKKNLYANVYWQGDSTDGNEPIKIIPGKTSYRIPAEYFDDGIRTRMVHSDINITSDELHNTIKKLVNSL